MKDFFEKNKIPIAIVVAGLIITGTIWLSNSPAAQQPVLRIDYTEAPEHVGEYACVTGKVDHVFTSQKGTVFINFCPNYRTCSFGAVIFEDNSHKFPNPEQYRHKTIEITGLIRSYQGRPEIILNDPNQIEIKSAEKSPVKESSALSRVLAVVDGDTIRVDIAGTVEIVRLIGIDAPEIANPHNPQSDYFGPEAAQYANKLMENQSVYLIPDPMHSNRDKYGRLLRYVFLKDGTLINAKLIQEGFAFNYIYEPFQFMKQFDYLEKQAKGKRLGLWAETK